MAILNYQRVAGKTAMSLGSSNELCSQVHPGHQVVPLPVSPHNVLGLWHLPTQLGGCLKVNYSKSLWFIIKFSFLLLLKLDMDMDVSFFLRIDSIDK